MEIKETLNLPKTNFPMKAGLPEKEPSILNHWNATKLEQALLSRMNGRSLFILHDGPPYANGHLHMGHALNKVLKDMINRVAIREGRRPVYIPGWDCHGLPIEHKVLKDLKKNRSEMTAVEIRTKCRESANEFVRIQMEEFRRMGVMADWEHPYLTMSFDYEASILDSFGKMVKKGLVYKGVKPVLWCPQCETALAEAEVEYEDHTSQAATVLFAAPKKGGSPENAFIAIWTTTPWTLPANKAVAYHPDAMYLELRHLGGEASAPFAQDDRLYVSHALWTEEGHFAGLGDRSKEFSIARTLKGEDLAREIPVVTSPLTGAQVPLLPGDFVTMDQGTGMVHIAPGHGEDDHRLGLAHGLPIEAPVDNRGRYLQTLADMGLEDLVGKPVMASNDQVLALLGTIGRLVSHSAYRHSYPHCWRCKKPVIFRATPQWFLSLSTENLRQRTLAAIRTVSWIPARGENRITSMIENRPDWCLSRQRSWGVPIPALGCSDCGESFLDSSLIDRLVARTRQEGIDFWFDPEQAAEIRKGVSCPRCQSRNLELERDILDVWFDSGVSHEAVLRGRPGLSWPADLYLEGSDQHRGWFHSSLLTSVALHDAPPYKSVLTHGFVVDGQGRKMAKTIGNVISPSEIIKQHGADILRLWAASSDYREDIRLSPVILSHLVESYRKIRNTFRFMMGNLYDYKEDALKTEDSKDPLDRWILSLWEGTKATIIGSYREYDFPAVVHHLSSFCSVSLSALYFDMIKDRLYTEAARSPLRTGTQKTMAMILRELLLLIQPILVFTSDEIAEHLLPLGFLPEGTQDAATWIQSELYPPLIPGRRDETLEKSMEELLIYRQEFGRIIDDLRKKKEAGSGLDVEVAFITGNNPVPEPWKHFPADYPAMFLIVSGFKFLRERPNEDPSSILAVTESQALPGATWVIRRASGTKCERCWMVTPATGDNPDKLPLCHRCFPIVSGARRPEEGSPDGI
ncbi:MAG: isoleucine--tRNA ligase [Nitrospiraceae bacterium]|nr:isoleucine--tRNA ligase [Nitrospiraceae bacterium]